MEVVTRTRMGGAVSEPGARGAPVSEADEVHGQGGQGGGSGRQAQLGGVPEPGHQAAEKVPEDADPSNIINVI